VSKHLGIEILRQNGTWPKDRWHDSAMVQYIYEQMDARRHSFQSRRWICVGVIITAVITSVIIGLTSALAGVALFAITIVSTLNYYQNNLSHYFSDPYEYELEVVENSLEEITETEATTYADIIMTRKEIERLGKRVRALSRNNFLFVDTKEHHEK